ncbi:hypothetical protein F2Q70_00028004 [Brassica cretica]|uniref:GATA-type domain-containing protein n=1 Tax=Brassica cretica TaxID=69181 RepID=A0A8S9L9G8_BRACR|nr:hypothetical protein F2Q70_00028004 [Brassica cretica]
MVQQFAPDHSDSKTYHLPSQNAPKNKRQMKNKNQVSDSPDSYNSDGTIRMCTHCETTETPQWREGPCGPKTLCLRSSVQVRLSTSGVPSILKPVLHPKLTFQFSQEDHRDEKER